MNIPLEIFLTFPKPYSLNDWLEDIKLAASQDMYVPPFLNEYPAERRQRWFRSERRARRMANTPFCRLLRRGKTSPGINRLQALF
jgi:hypothetical protein